MKEKYFMGKHLVSILLVAMLICPTLSTMSFALEGVTAQAPYAGGTITEQFQFEVTITESSKGFIIPLRGGSASRHNVPYNWNIDWGDGVTEIKTGTALYETDDTAGGILHTYTDSGTYTITITPNASTDAWFRAFGFGSTDGIVSGQASMNNRHKFTKVIGPITPLMTRTQTELNNGTIPTDETAASSYKEYKEWCGTFESCENITMDDSFNFVGWDGITKVGSLFAYTMFNGCSGDSFTMGRAFNLPQDITATTSTFAARMFDGCSGDNFTMNDVFNLPQGITSGADGFAEHMFSGCRGDNFTMNDVFNLPPNINTDGSGRFASFMFDGCSGDNFAMNDVFNLPQIALTESTYQFAWCMFMSCSGGNFIVNDVFTLPYWQYDPSNMLPNYDRMFCAIATPQKRTATSILGQNDSLRGNLGGNPGTEPKTFEYATGFADLNYIHTYWGGFGSGWGGDRYEAIVNAGELTFDTIKNQNITADDIISDLTLPTSMTSPYSGTIAWTADPLGVIDTETGEVTPPIVSIGGQDIIQQTTVTLTAKVTVGGATVDKTFTLTIKGTAPEPSVSGTEIYANGLPLILTAGSQSTDYTVIYIDNNGNGAVDIGDTIWAPSGMDDTDTGNDLSTYTIYGEYADGNYDRYSGDVRITMTGGKVLNIYGVRNEGSYLQSKLFLTVTGGTIIRNLYGGDRTLSSNITIGGDVNIGSDDYGIIANEEIYMIPFEIADDLTGQVQVRLEDTELVDLPFDQKTLASEAVNGDMDHITLVGPGAANRGMYYADIQESICLNITGIPIASDPGDSIFANGTPLIISEGTTPGYTVIHIDNNDNGTLDGGDTIWAPSGMDNTVAGNDLSAYDIYGGGRYGLVSDTKITMIGGNIYRIVGDNNQRMLVGNAKILVSGGMLSNGISISRIEGNSDITIEGTATVGSLIGDSTYKTEETHTITIRGDATIERSIFSHAEYKITVGGNASIGNDNNGILLFGNYDALSFIIDPDLTGEAGCIRVELRASKPDGTVIATQAVAADLARIKLTSTTHSQGKIAYFDGNDNTIKIRNMNAEEKVAADKDALTFDVIKNQNTDEDSITGDLTLPDIGDNGSDITWSTDPDGYIDTDTGAVTRPGVTDGDKEVTLTATIENEGETETKDFILTIISQLTPEQVEDAINDANTIAEIENLKDIVDALPNGEEDLSPEAQAEYKKKTEDAEAAQDALDLNDESVIADYEDLEKAVEAYGNLSEDQKELFDKEPNDYSDIKDDYDKVKEVIDAVDEITGSTPYTVDTPNDIDGAETLYNDLDPDQKGYFDDLDQKGDLDELISQAENARDVQTDIDNLTDTSEYQEIMDAQSHYDSLDDREKEMVDADKLITQYERVEDEYATVTKLTEKVNEVYDDPDRTMEDIKELIDLYEDLTPGEQAIFDSLTDPKDKYDELKGNYDEAKDVYDELKAVSPFEEAAKNNPDDLKDALKEYEQLHDSDVKKLIDNSIEEEIDDWVDSLNEAETIEELIDDIDHDPSFPNHGYGDGDCDDSDGHGGAIEDALDAWYEADELTQSLVDQDKVIDMFDQWEQMLTYLAYINTDTSNAHSVKIVAGITEVELPPEAIGAGSVIVKVVIEDKEAGISAPPEGKVYAGAVDIKLVAVVDGGDPVEIQPEDGKKVWVRLTLPDGFKPETIEIYHQKIDGRVYLVAHTLVVENGVTYAQFSVDSFSDFIFYGEKIDNGGTQKSSGGSGGSSESNVNVTPPENGTVTVRPSRPATDGTVTITVKPDKGYTLDTLTITDSRGNDVTYKDNGNNTFTYTQPEGKVKITVTFKPEEGDVGTDASATGDSDVSKLLNTDEHMAYVGGKGNGQFAPNANMTRAETAQMLYNLMRNKQADTSRRFPDVADGAWYAAAVNMLAGMDILTGYPDGNFRPDASITRAELSAIVVKFATISPGEKRFTDVPATHWAYDYINTAANFGWVTGVGDNKFEPDRSITRAEAVTLINNMLERSPDKSYINDNDQLIFFTDVDKTFWAFYEIIEAANSHDYEKDSGQENWK